MERGFNLKHGEACYISCLIMHAILGQMIKLSKLKIPNRENWEGSRAVLIFLFGFFLS